MNCDGCGKNRRDVRSCGRDSNGDSDAPCLCFICRKEGERLRVYNKSARRYVHISSICDECGLFNQHKMQCSQR